MNIYKLKIRLMQVAEGVVGREAARKMHLQICTARFKAAGVIFVHIPKAAGTSVAEAVIGRRAGHYYAQEIRRAMGNTFDSLFKFSVVRNPYARLASAYYFAKIGGGQKGAVRPDPAYSSELFSSFDRFVKGWLPYQNLDEINILFRPQHLFVADAGNVIVDYVGKIENPSELEGVLSEKLGRPIVIGRSNAGYVSSRYTDLYDEESRQIVRSIYKSDFELFDYDL